MLLFGWIAGILSNIYNIPQIYHTWKTKSSKDLYRMSILVRLTSYIFYIIHASVIKDPPLFWNTILSVVQVIIMIIQYLIYKKNEIKDEITLN